MAETTREDARSQAQAVIHRLGCGRGWDALAYLDHSGGRVGLGQASEVWETAMQMARLVLEITKEDQP